MQRLMPDALYAGMPSIGAQHPKFSPDGNSIVFAGKMNPGDTKFSIGVIPFTT